MNTDAARFSDRCFRAYGADNGTSAFVIDEALSPEYPLCVYRFTDGGRLVCLCGELEDAVPELKTLSQDADFTEIWDFLFEGSLECQTERALGFYLPQAPVSWAMGEFRALRRGDGAALAQLAKTDRRAFKAAGVRVRDTASVGLFDEQSRLLAVAGAVRQDSLGDISVFVRPDKRGQGLGASAVQALCVRLRELDLLPFYRAEEENSTSCALARSLGFVQGFVMTGGYVIA